MCHCQGAALCAGERALCQAGWKEKQGQMKAGNITKGKMIILITGGQLSLRKCPFVHSNRWMKARCSEGWKMSKRESVRIYLDTGEVSRDGREICPDSMSSDSRSLIHWKHVISRFRAAPLSTAWFVLTVSAGWMRLIICIKVNPTRSLLLPSSSGAFIH